MLRCLALCSSKDVGLREMECKNGLFEFFFFFLCEKYTKNIAITSTIIGSREKDGKRKKILFNPLIASIETFWRLCLCKSHFALVFE